MFTYPRRRGDEVVRNARGQRIKGVDELPWPAWDLFDVKAYDDNKFVTGIHYGITVPILATRGCPYQCTFCSSPNMWTPRWIPRDPAKVVPSYTSIVSTIFPPAEGAERSIEIDPRVTRPSQLNSRRKCATDSGGKTSLI